MRRHTKWSALVVMVLAWAWAPTSAAGQEALPPAGEIIDRYIEAVGGRDALMAYASSRVTGTFAMPAAGIQGALVVEWADPDLTITRVEIPGLGVILSGWDGHVGWSEDPTLGPRLLDGMELAATRESASRLAALRDPSAFDVRETVELTELNAQACYRVLLVWKSGRETFDCYHVETGLLVASAGRQETPMGEIETLTLMEDYQEFGGILSPSRIRQQMLGQEQVMTMDAVEYDVVDPSAFVPPETIRVLVEQLENPAG
jgi:hypothetical protein